MKTILLATFVCSSALFLSLSSGKKPGLKTALKTLEGFCNFVPTGKTVLNNDTLSVQSFYISSGEVTNLQYQEFLHDLKKEGETEKLAIAMIDSVRWNNRLSNNQSFVDYYHQHPAYHNYPVVNISKEGAELFCEWLSQQYDSLSNGELKLTFRLPTRAEWMRAARGDRHYSVYSWGGPYLRNAKGMILANFMRFGAENIHRNTDTGEFEVVPGPVGPMLSDWADVTAPSLSYFPNDYGIYNMNGNVSEMISNGDFAVGGDWKSPGYDIRNESIKPFTEPDPTVGFRVVASYINQ